MKIVKNYTKKWHFAISWKIRNGEMMHSTSSCCIPPLSDFRLSQDTSLLKNHFQKSQYLIISIKFYNGFVHRYGVDYFYEYWVEYLCNNVELVLNLKFLIGPSTILTLCCQQPTPRNLVILVILWHLLGNQYFKFLCI